MSYEQHQLDTILDIQADFDMALAEKKWDDAKALIQQMGDLGYETEAVFLHQAYNRAIADIDPTAPVYIPMEDNDHPILTPEEDDAPVSNPPQAGTVWTREGDEKFPETI